MKDKVTVVIPAYNKADYTVQALQSVYNQTYKDIEVIIIDDFGTDNLWEKIEPHARNKNFKFIRLGKNEGASAARNRGIKEATGKYLAFLDCDDLYLPGKIAASIHYLKENKEWVVHTPAHIVDKDNNIIKLYRPRRKLLAFRNYVCNSTVVVHRGVFDAIGNFDTQLFCCADWDMWVRLSENFNLGYLDVPLTYYRYEL